MSMRKERLRTASDQVTIEVRNTGDGATFALTRDDVAGGVMVVGEAGCAVEARDIIRDTRPDLLFLDVEMPEVRGTALAASLPEPRPFIVFATAFETYALDAIAVDATEKIAELTPDLVLLDIQMPGASGLDVAASLGQPRPAVIFCTAFDQYAVDAFELSHATGLSPTRFLARRGDLRQPRSSRSRGRRSSVSMPCATPSRLPTARARSPSPAARPWWWRGTGGGRC